jgi:hypothetical protein
VFLEGARKYGEKNSKIEEKIENNIPPGNVIYCI